MKSHARLAALLLAAALTAGSLSGCGSTPEGYTYTEAILDLYYDDDPAAYMALTGATEEEAHALYDSAFNETLSYFKTYYSVTKWDDESRAQCLSMYQDIYREKRRCKVLSCTQGTNKWTVTLEITPFELFADADDDYIAYVSAFKSDYEDGVTTYEDKDAFLTAYADGLVDLIEEHVDTAGYGEPETLTITVIKNADGSYKLDANDKDYLDVAILPYPEIAEETEGD